MHGKTVPKNLEELTHYGAGLAPGRKLGHKAFRNLHSTHIYNCYKMSLKFLHHWVVIGNKYTATIVRAHLGPAEQFVRGHSLSAMNF